MKVRESKLPGVHFIDTGAFGDARGSVIELWNESRYPDNALATHSVQDNTSFPWTK